MERYNIKIVEKKWQDIWAANKTDSVIIDKNKKKILLPRNVSISIRKNSYGAC